MRTRTLSVVGGLFVPLIAYSAADAGLVMLFDDGSGLSAEAEFTLLGAGDILEIRLKNTSTSIPFGFSNSDQLLTGVSWDFGHVGFNGDAMITGGSVVTGSSSSSINFSIANVGPNSDVSGEYGYGNMDGSGALTNFVSGNAAQAIPFGGANLDGPVVIDGPQAGLLSSLASVPLGGLGAIQDEIVATLTLARRWPASQRSSASSVRQGSSSAPMRTSSRSPRPRHWPHCSSRVSSHRAVTDADFKATPSNQS